MNAGEDTQIFFTGESFGFFLCTVFNTASSAAPQIPEGAGIEPQNCCDFGIGSHADALTTRLDLIHILG
jgi:hypothetical protein